MMKIDVNGCWAERWQMRIVWVDIRVVSNRLPLVRNWWPIQWCRNLSSHLFGFWRFVGWEVVHPANQPISSILFRRCGESCRVYHACILVHETNRAHPLIRLSVTVPRSFVRSLILWSQIICLLWISQFNPGRVIQVFFLNLLLQTLSEEDG